MLLSLFDLIWEGRKNKPYKDSDTYASNSLNDEQPLPTEFAVSAIQIPLCAVSDQATECPGDGGKGVENGCQK